MRAHTAFGVIALLPLAIASASPKDRAGYEREIDSTHYNQVPQHYQYILTDEFLLSQKNRGKLITKLTPDDDLAADNVIVESNVLLLKPRIFREEQENARTKRGYNLEHVNVPARYPYLPVPRSNRFRRTQYPLQYSQWW